MGLVMGLVMAVDGDLGMGNHVQSTYPMSNASIVINMGIMCLTAPYHMMKLQVQTAATEPLSTNTDGNEPEKVQFGLMGVS